VAANLEALKLRASTSPASVRYDEVGRLLTGSNKAVAADGLAWLKDLRQILNVPGLSSLGVEKKHIPEIAAKSAKASSMKANPIDLTVSELEGILEAAF
ncbi:MAG: iron-containing alcohol dehydrogenase, partial [Verrucomicrobia bacterium]|nr:iron-containing alcohol dehydrogenase [Verrucomicrobiota bacterium]